MDLSFRKGYEQGFKDASMEQMQQQAMQAQQEQQAMQAQMQGGQNSAQEVQGQEQQVPQQEQSQQEVPEEMIDQQDQGDLDAKLEELSNLVSKGEKPKVLDLRTTVESILDLRKSHKDKILKVDKESNNSQRKLISNILNKWENEANNASTKIEDIISKEGLKL